MNQIIQNQDITFNQKKIVDQINETPSALEGINEKRASNMARMSLIEAFTQAATLRREMRYWTPEREFAAIIHLTNFQQFMIKKEKEPFIENVNVDLCVSFVHQIFEKGLTNDQIIRKITFMINIFGAMRKETGRPATKSFIICFNHFHKNYYIKGE